MNELLNRAPCGFLTFDDEGTVILANALLAELLGYEQDELRGRHVETLLSVGGRIFYQTHFFPLLKLHGKAEEIYLSLRGKSGDDVPVLVNAARVEDDGRFTNSCVFIPMRQRSRYEDEILKAKKAAEEANRLKDDFLATVSHELRTPMTAMLGWVHMLRRGQLNEGQAERALEIIERNAQTQAQLVEDLLDVSRIISGKMRFNAKDLSPVSFIETAIESVRPAAEAKGVELLQLLDPESGLISGDAMRLQQVVWNLLSNAVKFTPKGGRVQVGLERVGSQVVIIVSDTGKGISPEFLPYVFERFRQADQTSKRDHGGLGLGLAIVRHLVEMHGGEVRAHSHGEGRGATFTVLLPAIASRSNADELAQPASPAVEKSAALRQSPLRLNGVRILAVDDEEDTRELLEALLGEQGASVTTVATVGDALESLRSNRYDVILSDIGMPHGNGYDFIREVRALPAELGGSTPAVALTAFARVEDRQRALQAGFQMHVPKPIVPSELIEIVGVLVEQAGEVMAG